MIFLNSLRAKLAVSAFLLVIFSTGLITGISTWKIRKNVLADTKKNTLLFLTGNASKMAGSINDAVYMSKILTEYISSSHHEWQKNIFITHLLQNINTTGFKSIFFIPPETEQSNRLNDTMATFWIKGTKGTPRSTFFDFKEIESIMHSSKQSTLTGETTISEPYRNLAQNNNDLYFSVMTPVLRYGRIQGSVGVELSVNAVFNGIKIYLGRLIKFVLRGFTHLTLA